MIILMVSTGRLVLGCLRTCSGHVKGTAFKCFAQLREINVILNVPAKTVLHCIY